MNTEEHTNDSLNESENASNTPEVTETPEVKKESPVVEETTEAVEESVESTKEVTESVTEEDATVEETIETATEVVEEFATATTPVKETASSEEEDHEEDVKEQTLPETDYNTLDEVALIAALRHLIQEFPINTIKSHVDEIKKIFEVKNEASIKEAHEAHAEAHPATEETPTPEFTYDNKLGREFNDLHSLYRKQRGEFQRQQRKMQEDNLAKRKEIIESIKNLIDEEENIGTTFKKFNDLQAQWRETGKIPHDAYNITWNDYRLHVQNFYDYIDLSKELRDKDFERNKEFLNKIIARAEELANEPNVHKALRELQELHRMWKEDAGPVSKEDREPVWQRFKEASDVIHDKRTAYYEERDKMAGKNQVIKENIVAEIQKITAQGAKNHRGWQERLQEINALKELFTTTGPAPKAVNNQLWDQFRTVTRAFNSAKNDFYKEIKKEHQANLDKKMALIAIAEEHQDSENFRESLEVMKRIQREWKEIGHVPRKVSDKIWKRFQTACNNFFDKQKSQKKSENAEEVANFDVKMKVYDALKEMLPQDDLDAMKASIEKHMQDWAAIGRVPYAKRHIQDKFDKLLKAKLKAAGMNAVDAEMMKYENKLESLKNGDDRDFKNERFYLRKRREEIENELRQLDNNMQFINAKDDKNPFMVQIKKNIASFNEELALIKEKSKQLNILQRQIEKAAQEAEAAQQAEENTEVTAEENE